MARPLSTQVDLAFEIDNLGTGTTHVLVDCARALSLVNRKLFRAGYVYGIDQIEIVNNGQIDTDVEIWKIPEIYSAHSAYKLAYTQWKRQRSEAADNQSFEPDGKSVMGRWSDFKLYYNEQHALTNYVEVLPNAIDSGNWVDISGGEWNRAEIVYYDASNTVREMSIGMLGDDNTPTYGGCIEAWGDTRQGVLTPDPLVYDDYQTSWIGHTGPSSEDLEQPIENLIQDENDHPPYLFEADPTADPRYVGGSYVGADGVPHGIQTINAIFDNVIFAGGAFPLGMFVMKLQNADSPGPVKFMVHMSRGDYKGVAALKMGDFS